MFDIGIQELIIIFIVALLVFGPKRLPEVGRTLGQWIGELRSSIQSAKAQMESEFEVTRRASEDFPRQKPENDDMKSDSGPGVQGPEKEEEK